MFKAKSSLTVRESRVLSGKDVKTIRKKLEAQFAQLSGAFRSKGDETRSEENGATRVFFSREHFDRSLS